MQTQVASTWPANASRKTHPRRLCTSSRDLTQLPGLHRHLKKAGRRVMPRNLAVGTGMIRILACQSLHSLDVSSRIDVCGSSWPSTCAHASLSVALSACKLFHSQYVGCVRPASLEPIPQAVHRILTRPIWIQFTIQLSIHPPPHCFSQSACIKSICVPSGRLPGAAPASAEEVDSGMS